MASFARQLLSDKQRQRRRDAWEDEITPSPRRIGAGKVTASEATDPKVWRHAEAGKLTHADAGIDQMSPDAAIRYADWITRPAIDRRAESGADDVDGGSLASAFEFIEASRDGEPLPAELRTRLSARLGVDLGGVRVHTDDRADKAAALLGARAFTIRDDIYFARGAYDPSSEAGVELIAHEVAHVAQQRGASTTSAKPRVSRPGDAHEREADGFASRFARDLASFPLRKELEAQLGAAHDVVGGYVGDAARLASRLLSASAFAAREVVSLADPSPQREALMRELTHAIEAGGRAGSSAHAPEVTISGSQNVLHRQTTGAKTDEPSATPWTIDDARNAFTQKFLPVLPKRGPTDPYAFAAVGPTGPGKFLLLFDATSKKLFQREAYQRAIGHETKEQKDKSNDDLPKLHKQYWQELGLVQPSIDQDKTKAWAYVDPGEHPTQQVLYLLGRNSEPDAKEMWTTYCAVVKKLHAKGSISTFTKIQLGAKEYLIDDTVRTAYTLEEYKELEDKLSKAIIAEDKYKWSPTAYWKTFYDEVCTGGSLLPQGVQGYVFKEIVKRDLKGAVKALYKQDLVDFADNEALFTSTEFTSDSKRRYADGFSIQGGTILLECKSGSTPMEKFVEQAGDYAKIVRGTNPIPGYLPPDAKGRTFNKVIYVFATQALANEYGPKVTLAFAGLEDRVQIIPDPNAVGTATVDVNPSFQIPLKQKGTAVHTILNPPIVHPGMTATKAVIHTDKPGSSNVVSGALDLAMDMAGGITADKITKAITGGDKGKGRLENKLPGLKMPGLAKSFPRLEADAKLTDHGVVATATIAPGPTGIPNLNLTASTLTATYDNGGALKVEGTINVAHTSGKLSGKLSVGYEAGQWRLEGDAIVTDGIVDGLSGFTARVKYDAGHWTVGVATPVTFKRTLGAVTLEGTAQGIEYDVAKGDFKANLAIHADLGMFGKASAEGQLEASKLKKVDLHYDSPELKYPGGAADPALKGNIDGKVAYENGHFSGKFHGTANLAIPALAKVTGDKGLALTVDAHLNPDGTYGGTIKSGTALKLGTHLEVPSFTFTLLPDGALKGGFDVKVTGFKFLETAKLSCTVDKAGVHVGDAAASFSIKAGPSGIPGFDLMASSVDVAYGEGGISAKASIGIKHTSGKLTGALKASWSDAGTTLDGRIIVDGLIDGIQPFGVQMTYAAGDWKVVCDPIKFEKKFPAVSLKGEVKGASFDSKKGTFSGSLDVDADLGMFGTTKAGAVIKDNKIEKLTVETKAPKLTYPATGTPVISGQVDGKLVYEHGHFSGNFHGVAALAMAALQKLTGDKGVKVDVAAHVNPDGSYGGTIKSLAPVKLGSHFEVPAFTCTLQDNGSVKGAFDVKATGFKFLEQAKLSCKIDDHGLHLSNAAADFAIKPGPSGIPGFDLEQSNATVRYDDSAGVSVAADIGIKHTSGKISGRIQASWSDAATTFHGTATVKDLIEGLNQFTLDITYDKGNWKVGVGPVVFDKKWKAISIHGESTGMVFDSKKGTFTGDIALHADMGMFGSAGAEAKIQDNHLRKLVLKYDSPQLKYPAKGTPAITGEVGGTLTYEEGKFSGRVKGNANLALEALKKFSGGKGMGLAVDAHVNADGSYGGTIENTEEMKFGDHFSVKAKGIKATILDDGSMKGDFAVKVVGFKYLEQAELSCTVDKDGVHIHDAAATFKVGVPNESRLWGELSVGYHEGKGFRIGGKVFAKLGEDLLAHGELSYDSSTNKIDLGLGIDKIPLLKFQEKRSLFKFVKQIPLVSFFQILGIYLDLGFELGFEFDFDVYLGAALTLDGVNPSTFTYDRIGAEMSLLGNMVARLTGTPRLGVGLFALSPSILRGGGGLEAPITAEAKFNPQGTFKVGYSSDGGVDGAATLGLQMTFGIFAELKPWAEFVVLDGVYEYPWHGESLGKKELLAPREIFNKTIDLGKKPTEKDQKLDVPAENTAAPKGPPPAAKQQIKQQDGKDTPAVTNKPTTDKEPKESGDQGPFGLDQIKPMIEGLPLYKKGTAIMEKAAKAYKFLKDLLGRILHAIGDFLFMGQLDKIEEMLEGLGEHGLGYVRVVLRKALGDTIYDIVSPLIEVAINNGEQIIDLLKKGGPSGAGDMIPWVLRTLGTLLKIGFNSFTQTVDALWQIYHNLINAATKLVTRMVQDGMIGVQRHCYYVWKPIGKNYYFLAADQYKIRIGSFETHYKEEGTLTSPRDVVGWALFEVLEKLDVPPTFVGWEPDAEQQFNDRWVGEGKDISNAEIIARYQAAMKQVQSHGQPAAAHTGAETPQRKDRPTMPVKP